MNARDEFLSDAAKAAKAEKLVAKILTSKCSTWQFEWVGLERECRHLGDIRATDLITGYSVYLEVKDDGVISESGNVLCEYEKYFYDSGYKPGNMFYNYEYYCVISQDSRTIYVIDFDVMKQNYRSGEHRTIEHEHDITYAYLLPLKTIEQKGGLLKVVKY